MPSLKKRFPVYSKVLKLYPKTYLRKYYTQTLQTTADMLDDDGLTLFGKLKIWFRVGLDLAKTIPLENIKAIDAKKFIPRSLIVCIVLITPLLINILLSTLAMSNIYMLNSESIIQKFFNNTWYLWIFITPFIAVLIALLAIIVWRVNKQDVKGKRKFIQRLNIATLAVVVLAGSFFLVSTSISLISSGDYVDYLKENEVRSANYQKSTPTIACSLLNKNEVKPLFDEEIYLDNSDGNNYSGVLENENNTQLSMCRYYRKQHFGVIAFVQTAKNDSSIITLKNEFDKSVENMKPITILNSNGFYSYSATLPMQKSDYVNNGNFNIRLWVDGNWLEVSAPNFELAEQAISTMVKNFRTHKAEARQAANDSLIPTNIEGLTEAERMAITQAVQNQEPTVIAGTTYTVNINGITGKQITGSFSYTNGLRGTFAVEKKQGRWQVVAYEKTNG